MKKVVTKHWLKVGDVWYGPGATFEVESTAGIANAVEVISDEPEIVAESVKEPEQPVKAEKEPEPAETPKTATRRRKATSK